MKKGKIVPKNAVNTKHTDGSLLNDKSEVYRLFHAMTQSLVLSEVEVKQHAMTQSKKPHMLKHPKTKFPLDKMG